MTLGEVRLARESFMGHASCTAGVHNPVRGVSYQYGFAICGCNMKQDHATFLSCTWSPRCPSSVCVYINHNAERHCSPRAEELSGCMCIWGAVLYVQISLSAAESVSQCNDLGSVGPCVVAS